MACSSQFERFSVEWNCRVQVLVLTWLVEPRAFPCLARQQGCWVSQIDEDRITVATEFMVYFGISKFWCNFRNLYTVNCTSEFLLYTMLDAILVFPTILCFLLHSKQGCSGQVLWVCLLAVWDPEHHFPKCVYRFWQYTGGWNIDHLCIRLITCLVNTDCE